MYYSLSRKIDATVQVLSHYERLNTETYTTWIELEMSKDQITWTPQVLNSNHLLKLGAFFSLPLALELAFSFFLLVLIFLILQKYTSLQKNFKFSHSSHFTKNKIVHFSCSITNRTSFKLHCRYHIRPSCRNTKQVKGLVTAYKWHGNFNRDTENCAPVELYNWPASKVWKGIWNLTKLNYNPQQLTGTMLRSCRFAIYITQ